MLCPFYGGAGSHLTQCGLRRGLPPYQVAPWSIQPFGHNTPMSQTDIQTGQDRTGQTTVQEHRANRFTNCRPKTERLKRNSPVMKSVGSVLRPEEHLWWGRFVKEVGFEPIVLRSFPIRWFTQTSQSGYRISADWHSSTSQKVGLPTRLDREMEPGQDFWHVTRPDLVVECCKINPRQRLFDSSVNYLSGNPNRLVV